nr:DUF2934 domain-containing protein [Bradyrhizobium sp. 186]
MSGPTEEEIRTKAYQLWKDTGEPACKMDRFWYQAETIYSKSVRSWVIRRQEGPTTCRSKARTRNVRCPLLESKADLSRRHRPFCLLTSSRPVGRLLPRSRGSVTDQA